MPIPSSPFMTASAALRWQNAVGALQEYRVIRDGSIYPTSFTDSYLFSSEFERAQNLKRDLIRTHAGSSLEEIFAGREVETDAGAAYRIESRHPLSLQLPESGELDSDLRLVCGIGPVTERRLRSRGYHTLQDLLRHPRYGRGAAQVVAWIQDRDHGSLMDWIRHRRSASDGRLFQIAGSFRPEQFVFFDIETLGIFSRPIILLGLARVKGGEVEVNQYLLREADEEPGTLAAGLEALNREDVAFVTYNGKSFDVPFLQERAAYYGLSFPAQAPHFDLLPFSRRRWRNTFANCKLTTLEQQLFGIQRKTDIPSPMVPEFYETYYTTGNPGPLLPIVEHNREDVLTLIRIFSHLAREGACS